MHRTPYCLAGLLVAAYLGLMFCIVSAGQHLQINWGAASIILVILGLFVFVSVANLIVMGMSTQSEETRGRFITQEELDELENRAVVRGFNLGTAVADTFHDLEQLEQLVNQPTPPKEMAPIARIALAIAAYFIGKAIAEKLLG